MTFKRSVTLEASDAQSMMKRVKRVERRAAFNKPEMKTKTFTRNDYTTTGGTALVDNTVALISMCNITEGTGINERIGDKIRIWRVEVRGIATTNLDHYIMQNHTSTNPGITSFSDQIGAYLVDSESNKRFTEWKHYRNYYSDGVVGLKFQQKFRNGIIVKYNGALGTQVVDNALNYVCVNRSGASQSLNCTLRVWYTDA